MVNKIKMPDGYREFRQGEDNLNQLNDAGKIGDLCQCGHLRPDHDGIAHHLGCSLCDCATFTWKAWVVKE